MLKSAGLFCSRFLNSLLALLVATTVIFATNSQAQELPALTEEELTLAGQFLAVGDFVSVLELISSREIPAEYFEDVLFIFGLASIEQSNRESDAEVRTALLDQAVAAFRILLSNNPGLVRVRLELARAFFLLEEDRLSRENFERVLASNPPPAVQQNVNQFLAIMHARRRLRTSFSVQVVGDSNQNRSASDRTVPILPGIFGEADGGPPEAGLGVSVTGYAEYRHPVNELLSIFSGMRLIRTEYSGSGSDETTLELFGGPEYQWTPQTSVSLQAVSSYTDFTSGTSQRNGGRLHLGHLANPQTRIDVRFGAYQRIYHQLSLSGFDATEVEASIDVRHRLSPTLTLDAGILLSTSNPEIERLENESIQGSAGVSALLPNGITLGFSVTSSRKFYKGRKSFPTVDDKPTTENKDILQATLLHRDFTVLGFSPQLVLTHEIQDGNAYASHLNSTRASISFVRQF